MRACTKLCTPLSHPLFLISSECFRALSSRHRMLPLYAQRPSSDERDRGRFYGAVVRRRSRAMGIRDRPTAPALPRQNGFAERMIGLIWRRDIDHIVVLTEALAPDLAILWLL